MGSPSPWSIPSDTRVPGRLHLMGIYDRDYYREDGPRWGGTSAQSMVAILILVNVAVYFLDAIWGGGGGLRGPTRLQSLFQLDPQVWRRPWELYQLLSYGFLHDERNIWHLVFNMLGLYFFGRDVEHVYGRREFLRVYVSLIVSAGLVWLVTTNLAVQNPTAGLIGASGGVMGLMVIFVMHFPRRVFHIWGVLPVQAWALAVIYIAVDLFGLGDATSGVAHTAHLGGAAFGYLYYRTRWCLATPISTEYLARLFNRRPKLKVHPDPSEEERLTEAVDRILEKISASGEASLTASERRTLEQASRRYQQRRRW